MHLVRDCSVPEPALHPVCSLKLGNPNRITSFVRRGICQAKIWLQASSKEKALGAHKASRRANPGKREEVGEASTAPFPCQAGWEVDGGGHISMKQL